jgi:hypothetical protein
MTDPTGRVFLSYRRKRLEEITLLRTALHDLGVPTWRDVDDLDEAPTVDEIDRILQAEETSGAVLWFTPEVEESVMIRQIEIPKIFERARRRDGFYVVLFIAGGLDYSTVGTVVDPRFTLEDLESWNLRKIEANPIGPRDAAQVAGFVLRRRLAGIHQALRPEEPIRLYVNTRNSKAAPPGTALSLQWSPRFTGQPARPGVWEESLLPALGRIVDEIEMSARGRSVQASGLLSIPAALALGCEMLAPRQLHITWEQYCESLPSQEWSLSAARETSGFQYRIDSQNLKARDLAVLVSVADDVEPVFAASFPRPYPFRALVRIGREAGGRCEIKSPGEAADAAFLVRDAIRQARSQIGQVGAVHLFLAVPAGLALMIGQLLNTLEAVQTYEIVDTPEGRRYRPEVLLRPSQS